MATLRITRLGHGGVLLVDSGRLDRSASEEGIGACQVNGRPPPPACIDGGIPRKP